MNKIQSLTFQNELQKTALVPRKVTEWISRLGMRRAAIKGDKAYIRRAAGETKKLLRLDPELDRQSTYEGILNKLKDEGAAKAQQIQDGVRKGVPGQGFLSRHKGKILLGGAAALGVAYATSGGNPEEEERRKQIQALQQSGYR